MYEYDNQNTTLSWHHKEFTDALLAEKLDGLEYNFLCTYLVLSSNGRSTYEQSQKGIPRGLQHVPRLRNYTQFRYLTKLVMNSNEIQCIDVQNVPVNVQVLDFDNNMIEHMPDFSHFELHTLQIACNHIAHVNGDYLPETITALHLDGNKLTHLPVMCKLNNLKRLYMSYNQIPELAVNNLPMAITHLYLHHNKLTHIGNITSLRCLQVLSLHDNEISSIEALPDSLTEITLGGNPLEELQRGCFSNKNLYDVIMKKHTVYFGNNNVFSNDQVKELKSPPGELMCAGYLAVVSYFTDNMCLV